MAELAGVVAIDATSKVPPYEQVRSAVAAAAADGRLAVGSKLPTVRGLAQDLSIAANTVARAYRELEQAGVVETRGRFGTFIAAAGDQQRAEARAAAQRYAEVISGLGLAEGEALEIVRAALRA
ncbi:GntR family transcriptional regulator [Spiractinospora alimapuensis]|uniref:GntR family transcriptional regulator n=1 Tax=Spiractinospora alimapuensis TaxID=2820884 RepID=UPI003741FC49